MAERESVWKVKIMSKKETGVAGLFFTHIIPIPPPAGIGGTSSLMFATTDSVVRSVAATLVAF